MITETLCDVKKYMLDSISLRIREFPLGYLKAPGMDSAPYRFQNSGGLVS